MFLSPNTPPQPIILVQQNDIGSFAVLLFNPILHAMWLITMN
jgi:hypothetical protein